MIYTTHIFGEPVVKDLSAHQCLYVLSHSSRIQLSVIPWTVSCQAPLAWLLQAKILEWVAISFSSEKVWSEWSEVAQSCLTLWNPMDCSLPGSSVHGIFQARELEWVAISFSTTAYKLLKKMSCIAHSLAETLATIMCERQAVWWENAEKWKDSLSSTYQ